MRLRFAAFILSTAMALPGGEEPPTRQEQEHILDRVRGYATDYTKRLPNFICTQTTRRFAADHKRGVWGKPDVIVVRLSYLDQREDYKLLSVNGRASKLTLDELGGGTTRGEFGSQLKLLFSPECRASFQWKRWATHHGRRTHVYSYRILRQNSQWRVRSLSGHSEAMGYHGQVFVDRDTGMVLRIEDRAEDIPVTLPILKAWVELDYGFVVIGSNEYLLPSRSETQVVTAKYQLKLAADFRDYRKFGSDSTITFDE